VASQTSGTVSSSVVSSRSGIADGVGTFHSLSRLQEICKASFVSVLNCLYCITCVAFDT